MLEHITDNSIPILETEENGYWEIYKDAQDHIIKKVWHPQNMSLEAIYNKQKENRKDKGKFIVLDSGESFEGEFVGVEETSGQFGEVNSFTFLINGEEKLLNSKSFKLLKSMVDAGVKEGNKVKITKEGTGFKTTFSVEKLS